MNIQIGLAQFNNPAGLEKQSSSILKETPASGTPRLESQDNNLTKSFILQGRLEGSNVQAVNEMVDLIVAQRAYVMNSKSITAADEMLQQANNLRR
jgi:flagellar basal-body rod protein FlgG